MKSLCLKKSIITVEQTCKDALVSIAKSEAICETWGSVIDKVSGDKSRSNDSSSNEMVYGTIENWMMVMLNGPPPGYKTNES